MDRPLDSHLLKNVGDSTERLGQHWMRLLESTRRTADPVAKRLTTIRFLVENCLNLAHCGAEFLDLIGIKMLGFSELKMYNFECFGEFFVAHRPIFRCLAAVEKGSTMRLFQDIRSAKWIYAKGILFVFLSLIAGSALMLQAPRVEVLALLLICVWASCRAYYFAFYVVEHYVDPGFRFSGLIDFGTYLLFRRRDQNANPKDDQSSS